MKYRNLLMAQIIGFWSNSYLFNNAEAYAEARHSFFIFFILFLLGVIVTILLYCFWWSRVPLMFKRIFCFDVEAS